MNVRLLAVVAVMLAGCSGSTPPGSSSSSSSGGTSGSSGGSTGGGTSGSGVGSGSLTGPLAFGVASAIEGTNQHYPDGGPKFSGMFAFLTTAAGTCQQFQSNTEPVDGSFRSLVVSLSGGDPEVVPGTYVPYPRLESCGPDGGGCNPANKHVELVYKEGYPDGGVSGELAVAQSGTVQVSAVGSGGFQASFDVVMAQGDGGSAGALQGTIDAPYCGEF